MASKNELKEIDIKNRACYFFDDIMRAWKIHIDTDFSGILLDEKLYKEKNKKKLIYEISYKTSTDAKPLCIRYNKVNGFIKIHNKTTYLGSFDKWCDKSCDRIKYVISKRSGTTDSMNYSFWNNQN